MTTFTAEQIQLQAHIEAENAKWVAECEAMGAEFYTTTVSDPAHWAEMGVFTVEQYKRDSLISYISDGHKDAYGFRPRHYDWDAMSMAELEALADDISNEVTREIEREEARKVEAVANFQGFINEMISWGAKDRSTALRWLTENETFYNIQDVEHWVYNQGILFTDYGRGLVKELSHIVKYSDYEEAA